MIKLCTIKTNSNLSGFEPVLDPDPWYTNNNMNNCYAYSANDNHSVSTKPQPGRKHYMDKGDYHKQMKKFYSTIKSEPIYKDANTYCNDMYSYHKKQHTICKNNEYIPEITCQNVKERMQLDIPEITFVNKNHKCAHGFYKAYLAVDIERDYHFWRQDSNGNWSHKPGLTQVTNVDASKNCITDPSTSNRDFRNNNGVNYSDECGYFCIPVKTNII